MRNILVITALLFLVAAPAAGQQLKLSFGEGGLVSLDATSVPVRQILNEWAKVGGTKVIGVDRVAGAPLTIKLIDVPEAQALEVILRSVAGYMAAPRSTGTGGSRYDRILVMATSSTPAPAAATPTNGLAGRGQPSPQQPYLTQGTQRFVPGRQQAAEEPDEDEDEPDQNPPNPPVFTFPQQPGQVQPGVFNGAAPSGQPMIVNPPINMPQPGGMQTAPNYPQPAVTTPVGSSTPGMINVPPPQPGQRPPGQRQ
jgi:hypothetical protein